MPLLYVRAIAPYTPGTNATDVIINQIHFNRTTLDHYNYTLYTNGTLSNGTDCYLAFHNFQPYMFPQNGSFVNSTSCYAPIHPVGHHASVGMAFAFLFIVMIIFNLANLRKHGRRYLPLDKRWNPVGRRWKWYWLMILAVCGTVGSFMSIDVDRSHVQSAPLVIQSVFYTLLTPIMMAAVWEAVRNWGTWQGRQIQARDPFAFSMESTTREKQELVLPLFFYGFAVINFFLTIPRGWDSVELQRSAQQQAARAEPFATDTRFKASGFVALCAVLAICYSLEHSIYRYIPRPSGTTRGCHALQGAPSQFLVTIVLSVVKIAYDIASAFDFTISPLRYRVNPGWIYGLGFAPAWLILVVFNICGLCEANEDKVLIYQCNYLETALADDMATLDRKRRRGVTWIDRLRPRQQQQHHYDDSLVEMETMASPPAEEEKTGVVDDDPLKGRVTTTTAAATTTSGSGSGSGSSPTQTDSQAGYRNSSDSMDFVRDVLRSIDGPGPGTGSGDRPAHGYQG